MTLLEVRGAAKRFGAVQALDGVDLRVTAGEVVALVGDNGAGKSTLVKAIAGVFPLDAGEVLRHGALSVVWQDLALCDNLDVVANLFLGRERVRHGLLDELEMEREAQALLARLGVTLPAVRAPVSALSGGQRQSVAVARAVLAQPKVMLLDEPTAALGVAQTAQVLQLVARLRSEGLGVLVVSHNLADVFQVADRIVVLRLGRKVAELDPKAASREAVVAAITGATA
ncbi:MAG: sugar ABC transporter ATP-binding protein [Archangiaceae bacterium]|nr:sugar ABC transporter ATP-binding protein [Archangiaceae bacterium]